mgnify:CR=1 FL=1
MKSIFKTLFLSELCQGLYVTARQFFARPHVVVQYPEEKTPQSPRFRGLPASYVRPSVRHWRSLLNQV